MGYILALLVIGASLLIIGLGTTIQAEYRSDIQLGGYLSLLGVAIMFLTYFIWTFTQSIG